MKHTTRLFASVLGVVLATATASLGGIPEPDPSAASSALDTATEANAASPMACCKTCTKGKACGDSCIAKNKDCHQPAGCACDG